MRRHIISLVACWALVTAFAAAQNPNWVSFPQGQEVNGTIYFLGEYQGRLIAGGKFTRTDSVKVNCIGLWDGSNWNSLGKGLYAYTEFGNLRSSRSYSKLCQSRKSEIQFRSSKI